jgi:hypothetical protein
MSIPVPYGVTVLPVDTLTTAKTITLPVVTSSLGRVITILDNSYSAATNPITINASGSDVINDNATTSVSLDADGASITLISIHPNKWRVINYFNGGLPG